jgi:hypothetical protein
MLNYTTPIMVALAAIASHLTFGIKEESAKLTAPADATSDTYKAKANRIWKNSLEPHLEANRNGRDYEIGSAFIMASLVTGFSAFAPALYTSLQTETFKTAIGAAFEASFAPFTKLMVPTAALLLVLEVVHQGLEK